MQVISGSFRLPQHHPQARRSDAGRRPPDSPRIFGFLSRMDVFFRIFLGIPQARIHECLKLLLLFLAGKMPTWR